MKHCYNCFWYVADVRDALVGVGLILNENGNFSFDKGLQNVAKRLASRPVYTVDLSPRHTWTQDQDQCRVKVDLLSLS